MPQLHNTANGRQPFSGIWNFQKVTSPGVLTFCISRTFHAGHLRSGQSRDHAHLYKHILMGGYWNCSLCNISDIIRTQTHQILLSCPAGMSPYLIFLFFCVTLQLTSHGSLWVISVFSSITSNRIEIESRKRRHCAGTELLNRLICDLTPSPIRGLRGCDLTFTSGQPWLWPLPNKKYIIWRGLIRGLRWCSKFGHAAALLAELWAKIQTTTFGSLISPLRWPIDLSS